MAKNNCYEALKGHCTQGYITEQEMRTTSVVQVPGITKGDGFSATWYDVQCAGTCHTSFKVTVGGCGSSYGQTFAAHPKASILDSAEFAGIDFLPYSGRAGADSASAAKLISGRVEQSEQSYLTDFQIYAGFILTDVAQPRSDITIEGCVEEELLNLIEPTVTSEANKGILPKLSPKFPGEGSLRAHRAVSPR